MTHKQLSLGATPGRCSGRHNAIRTLDRITTRKQIAPKRAANAFNPVARDEVQIFRALLAGQQMIRGFSNPDIRQILQDSPHVNGITDPKRKAPKVLPDVSALPKK